MTIPSPQEHFGFRLGDDRKLARWPAIVAYFERLAAASGRIKVEQLGQSTEGRPFIGVVLTSEANQARLDELREVHCRLADPRGLSDAAAEELMARARAVVMISCSIHATEAGATQMAPELAYELCTGDDAVTRQVLDEVIFVFVPSLNPDGLEIVADYYESTLGQPWEGGPLPFLYHKYVGHDNNRDWFMLTQVENQLAIDKVQNVWHPMIVLDQHQMWPNSFRYFLPPYIDPFDPNVDPLLQHQTTVLGASMINDLLANGKHGVTHSIIFDCFSPSRAYQHYHGGVRILSEAASCKIATPLEVAFDELQPARGGADPKVANLAHPIPWPGGVWRLRDIVEYNKITAWACLKHAARYRDTWVRNFYRISRNGLDPQDSPHAFVFPVKQYDPGTAGELLETLAKGMVEIHRAKSPFTADGVTYPAGCHVVLLAQPYGRYAKTLLERQVYPDLRLYPGGPPKPPYDITAHTLPLQMGVGCAAVTRPFDADLELVREFQPAAPLPPGAVEALDAAHGYLICPAPNASYRAAFRLLDAGFELYRCTTPAGPPGQELAGAFFLPPQPELAPALERLAGSLGLRVGAADPAQLADPPLRLGRPRLAMYRNYRPTADEGWTRFICEDYGVPALNIYDPDVKAGDLNGRFDTILVPGQPPAQITAGLPAGSADPRYTGGLGEAGRIALRDFVAAGGTLICLGPACDWAVAALGLRVRNVLAELGTDEFYLPGSMLRASFDPTHPVAYGMPPEATVLHAGSPAYEVRAGTVVGRYPPTSILQSGWALGEKHLADQACVVACAFGAGKVILLGPRVQFRAQTRGTYKLLFNSILWGSSAEVPPKCVKD